MYISYLYNLYHFSLLVCTEIPERKFVYISDLTLIMYNSFCQTESLAMPYADFFFKFMIPGI